MSAKFWLSPVSLAKNIGFKAKELRVIQFLVEANQQKFLEAWNEYFNSN